MYIQISHEWQKNLAHELKIVEENQIGPSRKMTNMQTIYWEDFRQGAQRGLLYPGDIVFTSNHKGIFLQRMIHGGQHLRFILGDRDQKCENIQHAHVYHVAFVVQNNFSGFPSLGIAEANNPTSSVISMEEFYEIRQKDELIIFRTHLPNFGHWLSYYASYLAKQEIPYAKKRENILALRPQRSATPLINNFPTRIDCGSFITYVYDLVLRESGRINASFAQATRPMNYDNVAPIHLYHDFQRREVEEGSWKKILYVRH